MSFGGITGNGVAAYTASMVSTAEQKASPTGATTAASRAHAASSSALDTIAHTRQPVSAQGALTTRQTQLTSDLQTAMSKSGLVLKGEVSFSMDASGALQVAGSKDDEATVTSFLKSDATKPGFAKRLTDLVQSADKLSASMRDNAAWVQVARYAGRNSNMMDLYSTFSQAQDTTAAVYHVDARSGSLSYPGVISSKA